jgi:hypothetical protein
MPQYPYVIFTLRRTGGTSLTTFLSAISSFPTLQHEPFNPDRALGAITTRFRKTKDTAELRKEIQAALATRPNIKHCIEIIPSEITRILIETCQSLEYRFIVLTRREEARRLTSLFLAKATGAWGSKMAADIYPDILSGKRTPEAVDLSEIGKRVRRDSAALGTTLTLLRNRNITYDWLVFEELYKGHDPIEGQAIRIADSLGITVATEDTRLKAFAHHKGQSSTTIESYVPNITRVKTLLAELCIT